MENIMKDEAFSDSKKDTFNIRTLYYMNFFCNYGQFTCEIDTHHMYILYKIYKSLV